MPSVKLRHNENFDSLLKRFQAAVAQDGVLKELKERSYYVKPSVKKRKQKLEKMKEFRNNSNQKG